jgi:hypothetical protein
MEIGDEQPFLLCDLPSDQRTTRLGLGFKRAADLNFVGPDGQSANPVVTMAVRAPTLHRGKAHPLLLPAAEARRLALVSLDG